MYCLYVIILLERWGEPISRTVFNETPLDSEPDYPPGMMVPRSSSIIRM